MQRVYAKDRSQYRHLIQRTYSAEDHARFFSRVRKDCNSAGCWEWTGHRGRRGYGIYSYRHLDMKAHRVSYEMAYGPVSDDLLVCHTCDNPWCVNPEHLFLGTAKDNSDDMVRKGREKHDSPPRGESHGMHKLTAHQVREIRTLYSLGVISQYALAAKFGISQSMVSHIVQHKNWTQLG